MKSSRCFLLAFLTSAVLLSQNRDWTLSSGKVEKYTGIVVANGRIGILPDDKPFRTKSIILNNVYDKESPQGVSKILLGINFAQLGLEIDGERIDENNISDWRQTLDMKAARFTRQFTFVVFFFKQKTAYELHR